MIMRIKDDSVLAVLYFMAWTRSAQIHANTALKSLTDII